VFVATEVVEPNKRAIDNKVEEQEEGDTQRYFVKEQGFSFSLRSAHPIVTRY
jgi:hypothetical protein